MCSSGSSPESVVTITSFFTILTTFRMNTIITIVCSVQLRAQSLVSCNPINKRGLSSRCLEEPFLSMVGVARFEPATT